MILDISAGGMLISSDVNLTLGGKIITNFKFEGVSFTEVCKIMRKQNRGKTTFGYGLKFVGSSRSSQKSLVNLLTQLQLKRNAPVN